MVAVHDLEQLIEKNCNECGQEHNAKFFSLFVGHNHYVIGDCGSCGYRIEIRLDQFGSGIFLPDGNPSVRVRGGHTEHVREQLETERTARSVAQTLKNHTFRFLKEE